ncbi:hypothetical protein [Methylocapsa palsarum]|uniref:Uncharacterized protein n=1 Tax=Methylocapsa palsarum TaxID=1612308 RepID=A0A1I4CRQ5_9HYPH|nr:hypothetical protein [Methylocapsa palsarum]SFK82917.1 hypothetical protein SAMN05444581_12628 [Methylocapsa palsarum]
MSKAMKVLAAEPEITEDDLNDETSDPVTAGILEALEAQIFQAIFDAQELLLQKGVNKRLIANLLLNDVAATYASLGKTFECSEESMVQVFLDHWKQRGRRN